MQLGKTLDECAAKYRKFCKNYRPKPKPESKNHWGSRLLAGMKIKKGKSKKSPGQITFPWAPLDTSDPEINAAAEKFVLANSYNPEVALLQFSRQCQVTES
ncbi:hypothetical protein MiSe_64860 [Microseira wollei NIES-4236]|uniref:Uncharacterized protein n=1 Tax=Microseira wollei NIES-4236 TaxID=2530354 RepID=A0AAV3XHA8_9CYAN|nr:hypothetical protein MiSe_64860 [Microseira wollei NIES-4236]